MEISRNIQELRVPLAVNLKTTIIFRIANGPDGWRASSFAQGPAFLWDQSIATVSPAYGTSAEALRVEAAAMIRRLKKTIKQARVRERVLIQLQIFIDALPHEYLAPANETEIPHQTGALQPSQSVVPSPPTVAKKTPEKHTPKAPKASTQASSEPLQKSRRRLRTTLLKKTSISASTRVRSLRSSRSVKP